MTNDRSVQTVGYGRLRLWIGMGWRWQRIGITVVPLVVISEWSDRVTRKSVRSGDERDEPTEDYKNCKEG
jgi:hypothetical protein